MTSLILTPMARVFMLAENKTRLPDPNPAFTPDQVMSFYMNTHPELTTATIKGPEISQDEQVFTFTTTIGKKG